MTEAARRQGGGRPLPPPPRCVNQPPRPKPEPVNREKTCPLLLRVFTKTGGHHTQEDYAVRGKEPKDEVQIYTWKDATLRELTYLRGLKKKKGNKKSPGTAVALCHQALTAFVES